MKLNDFTLQDAQRKKGVYLLGLAHALEHAQDAGSSIESNVRTGVMRVEGETGDLSSSGAASAAEGHNEPYNRPHTRQGWDVGDRDRCRKKCK